MRKHIITNRFGLWAAIIASFALAILDMTFLRDAFMSITGDSIALASIIAFLLATVANVSAFFWGFSKGHASNDKKQYRSFMIAWIVLGLFYAVVRTSVIMSDPSSIKDLATGELDTEGILGQAIVAIILTISYIGSGTTIQWAARQLFDADIMDFRKSQKEFKKLNTTVNSNSAALWELIDELKKYPKNYEILDKQYAKEYDKIVKNEKSIMAEIVSKTVSQNKEIDPKDADIVMETVLQERAAENKKNHAIRQQVSHR